MYCCLASSCAVPLSWFQAFHLADATKSVNPGFGGQSFIPHTLEKLKQTRALLDAYQQKSGRRIALEVDGGIKVENIAAVAAAGADTFVAGSAIFGQTDYRQVIDSMRSELAACR